MNKPYVHIENEWASLEECDNVIRTFGPKCKEHSFKDGEPFHYLGHFFTANEVLSVLPNFGKRVQTLLDTYEKKYPEIQFSPSYFTLNELRLQRYLPGNSFGNFHYEHSYDTPYRVFNFILYLSDNNCGTEFYTGEVLKTEPGRVGIFPTQFTHCHRGQPDPHGKERYIITGYFNYYNNEKDIGLK